MARLGRSLAPVTAGLITACQAVPRWERCAARRDACATRWQPFAVALISSLLVAGIAGCSPALSASPSVAASTSASAAVADSSQAAEIAKPGPLPTLSPPPIDLSRAPGRVHV